MSTYNHKRMKRSRKKTKIKPGAWFIPVRGSYLPVSTAGWLTYIPYTVYLLFALVVGTKDVHPLSLAVLFILTNWIAAISIMTYIASKKS
jgi:hypothetical protein